MVLSIDKITVKAKGRLGLVDFHRIYLYAASNANEIEYQNKNRME